MSRSKNIKGVLHNFLGTYTSRYSDYEGYWLFGLIIDKIDEVRIDLLHPNTSSEKDLCMSAAIQLAAKKFGQQIEKAKFSISSIKKAELLITKSLSPKSFLKIGNTASARSGHDVRFVARVELNHGIVYENETLIFIAPHDPHIELRSSRLGKSY